MAATSFAYRARTGAGKMQSGYVDAETRTQAAAELRRRRLYVVDLRPAPGKGRVLTTRGLGELMQPKVGLRDLALFCRQFATVVEAGIPLLTSLDILGRQAEPPRLARAITEVSRELQGGRTLAEAMGSRADIFPGILISMVEAGELGGVLDKALLRLAEHFERDHDIREKVKSALFYPATLVCIGIVAVTIIVTFVLPRIVGVLVSADVKLPLLTVLLMGLAGFIGRYWYLLPVIGAGLYYGVRQALKVESVRHRVDGWKLKLPVFGPLLQKVAIARFCRTLSTLLKAGVPLIQSLTVVKGTAGNYVVAEAVDTALVSVRDGLDMGTPLARSKVFPPLVSRMVMVGEDTGTTDQLLEKVAVFYDREVGAMVDRLSAMLEPVLLLFMGSIIGTVIMSIMLPLFKVMSGSWVH